MGTVVMVYVFWISAYQYYRPDKDRTDPPPRQQWRKIGRFIAFSNRKTIIFFQVLSAVGNVTFILLQVRLIAISSLT
jgi:hypothetical protein